MSAAIDIHRNGDLPLKMRLTLDNAMLTFIVRYVVMDIALCASHHSYLQP